MREREGPPARITEAGDFVRIEVAAALASGMRVIPLLLDGTTMPSAAQLPDDLRDLADRNALKLDNSRYAANIERLAAAVREALGEPIAATPPARDPRARTPWIAGAAALFAVAALALFWALRPPTRATPAASASAPSAARAAVDDSWQAALEYDWPNARYTERFVLGGEGRELHFDTLASAICRGKTPG